MRFLFKLISLILCLIPEIQAQDVKFRKLDMRNGLSFNSVMCITEDSFGQLWVGTREGLNRFDGYNFEIFRHRPNNSADLSNNHINVIFEDSEKKLWVGTANGLNLLDRQSNTFEIWRNDGSTRGISNGYVKSIVESAEGKIWIGTSKGISVLDKKTNVITKVYIGDIHTDNVISLFKDHENRIWAGTKGGLFVWSGDRFKRIYLDPLFEQRSSIFEIRDIKQDSNGIMYIATEEHGVYRFAFKEGLASNIKQWTTSTSGLLANQTRRLLIDDNKIWVATLSGLSILDISSGKSQNMQFSIYKPQGISRGSVHDIHKDSFGGFWVATYSGGLNYFHPQNNLFEHHVQSLGANFGLSENDVNGFLEDQSGSVWISTGRGLNHYNTSTNTYKYIGSDEKNGLSHRVIKSMVTDKDGNLWVGTYNGLNHYNPKTGDIKRFYHQSNTNSLNQNQVHALYYDSDSNLWIGTNVGEFQIYNTKTGVFTDVPGVGNIISYIYEDKKGKLWVGTRGGLKCLDRKTKKTIDISNLLKGYEGELLYVNWIMEDSEDRLWIGTQSSGLFHIKDDKLFWFGHGKGLSSNTINAILEDDFKNLWLTTNSGISKIEYWLDKKGTPSIKATDFTEIHGLQGPQFNPGSALKTKSGKMYFGGINGFNVFKPSEINKIVYFPKVNFNKISITSKDDDNDVKVKVKDSALILKYSQRNVSIVYSSVNFVNSQGIYYRYTLNTLRSSWIDAGKQRNLNLTYLPVGTHELKVQATTQPGVWGDEFSKLTIKVLPPWWMTPLAYITYAVLLSLGIYYFVRLVQKRSQLKSKKLISEALREREQRMINSKLEFFTDISHELRTPLTLILTPLEKLIDEPGLPSKVSSQLTLIERNGKKMMEMVDEALSIRKFEDGFFRPSENDLVAFLNEMFLSFKPLAEAKRISFLFNSDYKELKVMFDPKKLDMAIQNLLSNAFKFTPTDGKIGIYLSTVSVNQKETIQIVVENTGSEISEEILDNMFKRFFTSEQSQNPKGTGIGLDVSLRMIKLHGGELSTKSNKSGKDYLTQFIALIPLKNSEYTQEETIYEENVLEERNQILSRKENVPTLLLAEDNREIRDLVKSILSNFYDIVEAENGELAWIKAQEITPDLIISDIMMPVMDGIELCKKIKTDPRTSHIPVVLLTARSTSSFKYEGYETGADAYITKPFSSKYLTLRINNLIQQREKIKSHLQKENYLNPGTVIVNTLDDNILRNAKKYVEDNIQNSSFTIEQLCREVGLSRMHFHRKMKSLVGISPAEFVRNIRLNRAAVILKQNNISIKETMALVGFENADHFRKCFKDLFGVLPSEYK